MSAAQVDKSGWWGKSYDKVVLIVVLVLLLASALLLLLRIGKERAELARTGTGIDGVEPIPAQPVDVSTWTNTLAAIEQPFQSGEFTNKLMVSELRVLSVGSDTPMPIPYYADVDPFTGIRQPPRPDPTKLDRDADGIPDRFEVAYGLNPADYEDAQDDEDGDGFLNIEEFKSGTNLRDAADYPPPVAKLRMLKFVTKPFKLRFQGVQELHTGDKRFLLNLRNLEKSYFAAMNEEVHVKVKGKKDGDVYKVVGYDEIVTTNVVTTAVGTLPKRIDESVLTIEKDGKLIKLVKNKAMTRHEKMAYLIFLIDQKPYVARIGGEINLKGRVYKVIDIQRNGVKIRDVETGQDSIISKLSENERERLRAQRERAKARATKASPEDESNAAVGGAPGYSDVQ